MNKYEVADTLRKAGVLVLKKYEVSSGKNSKFVERPVVNMELPRRVTDFKPGAVQIDGMWLELKDSDRFEVDEDKNLCISIMGPEGYYWVRMTYQLNNNKVVVGAVNV